jgi:membrane-associated phospholipid phosphatase
MICTWRHKLKLLGLFAVGYLVCYLWPNLSPRFEPRYLPLTFLDRTTPFLPWSFWIYTSDYVLIASVVYLLREKSHFDALARMGYAVLGLCGLFFLFFPTTYPRPVYPETVSLFVGAPMRFIASVDTPSNCFPSMHVALTGVSAWALRKRCQPLAISYAVWTLAICLSTLTTKQHYVWDVAGGLAIMLLAILWEKRVEERMYNADRAANR